ncbi:hypothetical protein Lesp02_03510 [Lentzea sp. NBRC 105346]|uniref:hypothetical protein n=1 Tax=Lentzea sp. NBRC 105346 TaxID=3032205 RepID=UPI00249FA8A2|nr:hypothetical protein [Lentzea sp. NBRC 105346]GLZ28161.1 hypothetical protein Lesp02_03510 [Lentzea sp. NBRC 105346]
MEPAWVAAAAALVSSGAAIWSAFNGNRTLRRADRDSQARSRPMIAAELRDEPYAFATQILVIRNYGSSIGRNVRVTFDPPLPDPIPERAAQSVTPFLKARYADPIPVLTPGMELDNIYYSRPQGHDDNFEPLPDKVTVTIEYDGPDGAHYADAFPLNVDVIRQRTYVTSSAHPSQRMKEAVKQLKEINSTLRTIVRRASGDGAPHPAHEDLVRKLTRQPAANATDLQSQQDEDGSRDG